VQINDIHTKIISSHLGYVTFEHVRNTFIPKIITQIWVLEVLKLRNLHFSPNIIWINKLMMRLAGYVKRAVKGTLVPVLN
jgi:hypothetical protein